MKCCLFSGFLLAIASLQLPAQEIDLGCETLAQQMIERLSAQGLLIPGDANSQRARAISMELCGGAEVSAQQQHEVSRQEALDNWFFEQQADKPGNRRLRNLKR